MNETVKDPTRWLTQLLDDAKHFDGTMFPPSAPLEDEKVIGVCPESLRPYHSYACFCEREMKQARLDMEYLSSEEERIEMRARMVDMKARQSVAGFIFWSCINDYLGMFANSAHLQMVKDWKIVEKECNHGPEEMIRKLFGG